MTATNYQRTQDWLTACGKTPSPEAASVQIGCHIEEFCEFLDTLRTDKEGYAKLIAAAPDLLAALQAMIDAQNGEGSKTQAYHQAQAAIAKATAPNA